MNLLLRTKLLLLSGALAAHSVAATFQRAFRNQPGVSALLQFTTLTVEQPIHTAIA